MFRIKNDSWLYIVCVRLLIRAYECMCACSCILHLDNFTTFFSFSSSSFWWITFSVQQHSLLSLWSSPRIFGFYSHTRNFMQMSKRTINRYKTLCVAWKFGHIIISLSRSLSLSLRFTSSFFKRFVGQSTSSSSLFVVVVVVAAVFVVVSVIEVMTLDSSDSFRRFLIEFLAIAMNFPFFHSLFFSSLSVCNFHYLALTP